MIEILPESLSRFIQLIGLQEVGRGRYLPKKLLFARRLENKNFLEAKWLEHSPQVPIEVILNLVAEWIGEEPKGGALKSSPPRVTLEPGQRPLIWIPFQMELHEMEDFLLYWEKILMSGREDGGRKAPCPNCGSQAYVLWKDLGCTRCLLNGLRDEYSSWKWILIGASPLMRRDLMDIQIFLWAWGKIEVCPRCSSRKIRLRRIFLDFPKTRGPVVPLWNMAKEDLRLETMLIRERQLRAFTRGIMRVTFECPQCGFMEMEFLGEEEGARFPPIQWDEIGGKR